MNTKNKYQIVFFLAIAISSFVAAQPFYPSDKKATKQTVTLYRNLQKLRQQGFMFGHQDDLAYGVHWKYENGRSDIKDVTGDYPAIYGWELGRLEIDAAVNLDSVPFLKMKQFIQQIYRKGGVVTISWHLNNPLTGKSAWDPAPGTVASILEGGAKHEFFKTWLDKIANFMNQLKGDKGEFIPIIFRPFHELNGNWFWWGGKNCTPDDFKKLWMFTINYLREVKNIHHLLYAYNTDRFSSPEEYLSKYPGDEFTDILGFDIYQRSTSNATYINDMDKMLSWLEEIADKKNKIPALTEFGGNLSDSTWWTDCFLNAIARHKIAYALAWRNAGNKPNGEFEYYVPYKGNASQKNFTTFYDDRRTFFQKDVTKKNLYQ